MRRPAPRLAFTLLALGACAFDSSGSEDGAGGMGGAGPASSTSGGDCTEGATSTCYDAEPETLRGACRTGTRTCVGAAWSECQGQVLPAAEDCSEPEDEDCDGQAPPCQSWARVIADPGAGAVRGALVDARGGVSLAGWVQGEVDFGSGPQATSGVDALLLRLDADGAALSANTFGDARTQLGQGVALGTDGALAFLGRHRGNIFPAPHTLASEGQSNVFLARFGADGALAWTRGIGSFGNDDGGGVGVDSMARTVAAANVAGPGPILVHLAQLEHAGSTDVVLASFDAAGEVLWAKAYGDADNQTVNAMAVMPDDDVVFVGAMRGTMDTGSGAMTSAGESDAFVARVRADGGAYWSHVYGGTGDETATAVAVAPGGGLCIAGSFSTVTDFGAGSMAPDGLRDAFVLRMAASGKLQWARRIGGVGVDVGTAVTAAADGGCIVGGSFEGTAYAKTTELVSSGGSDAFVVRYDVMGTVVFARVIGGRGDQDVSTLASDAAGALLVGGHASVEVDLGDGAPPVPVTGPSDPFLVRLAPPG